MHDVSSAHDYIDDILTSIVTKIDSSPMSDTQKAEAYMTISGGLHRLVWPIVVSHVPHDLRESLVKQQTPLTIDQYADVMDRVFQDSTTGRDIFDQVYGALKEVDALIDASF